jgi:hypothetical protein
MSIPGAIGITQVTGALEVTVYNYQTINLIFVELSYIILTLTIMSVHMCAMNRHHEFGCNACRVMWSQPKQVLYIDAWLILIIQITIDLMYIPHSHSPIRVLFLFYGGCGGALLHTVL